jgi:translocation and assembly module TamA
MRLKAALLTSTLLVLRVALAADPQPYAVRIPPTGNASLDATLRASSQLVSLRTSAPVGPFALIGRAQQDIERLKTVLESFGYYRSTVTMTINGRSLDDAGLPEALEALPKAQPAQVSVQVATGPLFHLRFVTIDGTVDHQALDQFKLGRGDPAVASEVLAARQRLLSALQEEGRAFAKVEEPIAYEAADEPVLDITFHVEPGEIYQTGDIRFEGLKRVHEAFIRRGLKLQAGQLYQPSKIEQARAYLLSLGVFAAISVRLPKESEVSDHEVPITFVVQERLRHAVSFTAGYSTDLGGSVGTTWTERNLFGNAEQLTLMASVINAGGTATLGLGYNLSAQLTKPDFLALNQSLQFGVIALKEDLDAYDQTSQTASATLNRKLSSTWTVSAGVSVEEELIVQEIPTPFSYTILSIPLSVRYDSTDLVNLLDDPLHGLRVTFSVSPSQSLGHTHSVFAIAQSSVATYFDLTHLGWSEPGRSVIAVRGLAGQEKGAGETPVVTPYSTYIAGNCTHATCYTTYVPNLPPDQRFYGGGTGTVRGFRYQSIGPTFPIDDNPVGGSSLGAVNAEFRQRFGRLWGMAVFMDGGTVTNGDKPFTGPWSIGYGAGARFYTPIGPVRLDVALPLERPPKGDAFEVYVGLGQAF